jgi:hypothetical protein
VRHQRHRQAGVAGFQALRGLLDPGQRRLQRARVAVDNLRPAAS